MGTSFPVSPLRSFLFQCLSTPARGLSWSTTLGMKSQSLPLAFKAAQDPALSLSNSPLLLANQRPAPKCNLPLHASEPLHMLALLSARLFPWGEFPLHSSRLNEGSPPPGGLTRLSQPFVPPLSGCLCRGSSLCHYVCLPHWSVSSLRAKPLPH